MNILITGTSSGLGYEIARQFSKLGHNVFGISRRKSDLEINQVECDFFDLKSIPGALNRLIEVKSLDHVILNAGQLGELKKNEELSVEAFKEIFSVNVLANKMIIDWLIINKIQTKNIIGISTGAALKAYFGWSLYCTSKAAFKQLMSTYAHENPKIKFISLAPGIIKTNMQNYINGLDADEIPSIRKFKDLYPNMESASTVARRLIEWLPKLNTYESGEYFDLREYKP
ncbi:MAG: SDR family NAD(P)-dependent oxidoreductase [Cyclobacteriaceae bacterium]